MRQAIVFNNEYVEQLMFEINARKAIECYFGTKFSINWSNYSVWYIIDDWLFRESSNTINSFSLEEFLECCPKLVGLLQNGQLNDERIVLPKTFPKIIYSLDKSTHQYRSMIKVYIPPDMPTYNHREYMRVEKIRKEQMEMLKDKQ